ncbi:UDP-N-acetylmuramoyl-L-alanine--D-glutamate ligase [Thalassotalea sp. LPB0316]|uniref:UDP-N-acetylmuramoyl-L-alanine--D-glutamate ligase n=1 Tax=Thalassotalea sp. LPB0316 TaxID=2769490 RepID=UPI0018661B21|nr:UDP-N-acetylmuramoyl-L-alanine--D-glutamate ligase [Thalassotalea sp. LPB0316]QOL25904.1 UDP-N-acetylmuramoyl-L-alanine--D-glutamate ligase [Thalassotalea sp. LPB0316]
MLDIAFLQDKRILVLGAGLSGLSCARFLTKQQLAFDLNDSRANAIDPNQFSQDFPTAGLSLGRWDSELIANADIILVSPGIDTSIAEIQTHLSPTCQMYGDVELYCRLKQTPIIAITGSNGKSTVVSLVAHLGKCLGYNTQLAGNIGVPPLDVIDADIDFLALELSSFQLETLSSMQAVSATLLNLCDDHLDRHKTLANYRAIKQRIYQQTDCVVVNRDDQASAYQGDKRQISFGLSAPTSGNFGLATVDDKLQLMFGETPLIAVETLPLTGIHNAINCLAALALGYGANWPIDKMVAALGSFEGLAHRCQRVETTDQKIWINDSKATNVGATIAAIEGLTSPDKQLVLIAGGQGKGADFSPLTKVLAKHVNKLIVFGQDKALLASIAPTNVAVEQVGSLNDAVCIANQSTERGDTILFSPACASLDMFTNYIARGNAFARLAQEVSSCTA